MSVEIKEGHYLGGMPAFDHRIEINGVTIGLSREDFAELADKIDKKVGEDYAKALQIYNKWSRGLDTARELKKDITELFWHVEEDSDYLFKKAAKEINIDDISNVLEKYKNFLGLE